VAIGSSSVFKWKLVGKCCLKVCKHYPAVIIFYVYVTSCQNILDKFKKKNAFKINISNKSLLTMIRQPLTTAEEACLSINRDILCGMQKKSSSAQKGKHSNERNRSTCMSVRSTVMEWFIPYTQSTTLHCAGSRILPSFAFCMKENGQFKRNQPRCVSIWCKSTAAAQAITTASVYDFKEFLL